MGNWILKGLDQGGRNIKQDKGKFINLGSLFRKTGFDT
jgi:hypothetical protein